MTDKLRAAVQETLNALETYPYPAQHSVKADKLCAMLRAALAEPVAWTPVEKALPKSGVTVLACYRNRLGNLRRIRAHWIAAKTEEVDGDFDYGEYDEETDCWWTPEGWYECIDNWEDYSSVAVCEGEVTHWMPLPPEPGSDQPRRVWVGLTDEEKRLFSSWLDEKPDAEVFAAIEAALRERNA